MLKKITTLLCVLLINVFVFAQEKAIYPTHWWTDMKWNKVQLLLHSPGINSSEPKVNMRYRNVVVEKVTRAESPNYIVVDLYIRPRAKPGTVKINVNTGGRTETFDFPILQRQSTRDITRNQGVNSADFIYLLMPDRFTNGDPANDVIREYRDTISDPGNSNAHQGGDLAGVQSRLDYLSDLGITTVWMCPVLENDMPWKIEPGSAISGYHGYWITDHYQVDKRFGGNQAYKNLVNAAHQKGMKIIQDAVYNHVGDEHLLFRDKPFADMFNLWPQYTGANHREESLFNPYMSQADRTNMLKGWFVSHLPDLNLANPYMANFMIQSVLWSTEEFGVDGWRVDTYKYCDEGFLNKINDALFADFPRISAFGEAWCNTVTGSAYFTQNNMDVPFRHNMPGVTDFPLQSGMMAALFENYEWTAGVNKLMMTLSQDVLYQNPMNNCIFLDNHDMDRFATMIGGDMNKYKMGIAMLLTMRGIPQMYFGTETFLQNLDVAGDGRKRNPIPGAFIGAKSDKFTEAGRTDKENEAFNYVKTLANFRKNSPALKTGSMINFIPENGIFVYFRKNDNDLVMCIVNQNKEKVTEMDLSRFKETLGDRSTGKNVVSGETYHLDRKLLLQPESVKVIEIINN